MFIDDQPKHKNEFMEGPCPVCGGTDFQWGTLYQARHRASRPVLGVGKVVDTRRCLTCDNILLFADEEATRKQNQYAWIAVAAVIAVTLMVLAVTFMMIGPT